MTSETVATIPADRILTKLGVGEKVDLRLKLGSLPSPSWELKDNQGTSKLTPLIGITSVLTAGERACTPITEATTLGKTVKIDFNVIQPEGVNGLEYTPEVFAAGVIAARMNPLIINVEPNDVSFYQVQVKEIDKGSSNITGFFSLLPISVTTHQPNANWSTLAMDNHYDDLVGLTAGSQPLPLPGGPTSTLDWSIDIMWKVVSEQSDGVFLENITQTHSIDNFTGTVTVSKVEQTITRSP